MGKDYEAPPNIERVLLLHRWLCQEAWLAMGVQFKRANCNLVTAFEDYQKIKGRQKIASFENAF